MPQVETIDRILRMRGDGLPVLSLYARFDPDDRRAFPSRVNEQLHDVRPLTHDHGLDREARLSLRDDVARIEDALARDRLHPRAVAFFSCSGRGLFEEVELPRPVRDGNMIDETAWVRPMLAVLDGYHRCRVVVVDHGRARFFDLYGDDMVEVGPPLNGRTLRKPDYAAGMREYTTRNKAERLAHEHYRAVAERLDEEARDRRFDIVAVGGHEYEVPEFLAHLPRNVRERVAGTFTVHPREDDVGAIRGRAQAVVQRYESSEQQRLVTETLDRFAAGGLAVAGLRDCLWGASTAAVGQLLVQEGAEQAGAVCDVDGYLTLEGERCPLCGRELRRTPDVIDEMVQSVIDEGGGVEHVGVDTALREHVTAAGLRFPLPPYPADRPGPGRVA